jgi:signal transduction histidine kinase
MCDSRRLLEPVPAGRLAEGVRVALHEVRRPLALARGYLEMALGGTFGPVDDGLRHPLSVLEGKLDQVQQELEQLALLARMGAGEPDPELKTVDLGQESRRAADRMRPGAELQDACLDIAGGPRPVAAAANPMLLARILDNLIQNALTYSDRPARILVEVGDGEEGPFVRVRDHGIGMDRHSRAHIFDRGFRGDPGDGDRPGSGLGLSLSRHAAQQMGATLDLEWSRPGHGTSFLLSLQRPSLFQGQAP